jgi:hypothetical protein
MHGYNNRYDSGYGIPANKFQQPQFIAWLVILMKLRFKVSLSPIKSFGLCIKAAR